MKPTEQDEPGLDFLLHWDDDATRARRRGAGLASILTHAVAVLGLVAAGKLFPAPRDTSQARPEQHITLLFAPPALTTKTPTTPPPSKVFFGENSVRRPPLMLDLRALRAGSPPARKSEIPVDEKPPQLTPKPEPSAPPQLAQMVSPPAAPPPPASPPKLVLEDVNKPAGGRSGSPQLGAMLQQKPGGAIEGAIQDLAKGSGRGGAIVGDGDGGGTPNGSLTPSRGSIGSNLQLLSDPMGVDFKPYLIQILALVRRNWYAVIPESARLGMVRGRVSLQLILVKQGNVLKLVISSPSGIEALDRAAVAGISASNPFPPLPPEFLGNEIKLQFTFLYNIPSR